MKATLEAMKIPDVQLDDAEETTEEERVPPEPITESTVYQNEVQTVITSVSPIEEQKTALIMDKKPETEKPTELTEASLALLPQKPFKPKLNYIKILKPPNPRKRKIKKRYSRKESIKARKKNLKQPKKK
jgi:hypothetical protein